MGFIKSLDETKWWSHPRSRVNNKNILQIYRRQSLAVPVGLRCWSWNNLNWEVQAKSGEKVKKKSSWSLRQALGTGPIGSLSWPSLGWCQVRAQMSLSHVEQGFVETNNFSRRNLRMVRGLARRGLTYFNPYIFIVFSLLHHSTPFDLPGLKLNQP